MKPLLAVLWTGVLISQIVGAFTGRNPGWMDVFCPLSILCLRYWVDTLEEMSNKR